MINPLTGYRDGFRQDNTEGFTDAELATMNDEYFREITAIIEDLPEGADGLDDDTADQIAKTTAEAVLRRHGAA